MRLEGGGFGNDLAPLPKSVDGVTKHLWIRGNERRLLQSRHSHNYAIKRIPVKRWKSRKFIDMRLFH